MYINFVNRYVHTYADSNICNHFYKNKYFTKDKKDKLLQHFLSTVDFVSHKYN